MYAARITALLQDVLLYVVALRAEGVRGLFNVKIRPKMGKIHKKRTKPKKSAEKPGIAVDKGCKRVEG
jgi:hypothetical protein